jgi:hypothetical protein
MSDRILYLSDDLASREQSTICRDVHRLQGILPLCVERSKLLEEAYIGIERQSTCRIGRCSPLTRVRDDTRGNRILETVGNGTKPRNSADRDLQRGWDKAVRHVRDDPPDGRLLTVLRYALNAWKKPI